MIYTLFGLPFESEYRFDSLLIGSGFPVVSLFELQSPLDVDGGYERVRSWEIEPGVEWLVVFRTRTGYHLRFPHLADFLVTEAGDKVYGFCRNATSHSTFEHLVVDQVLPLVLSISGHCILHCSSVASPGGAVAFCGKSGQGKSTLASSLAVVGHTLITDDCLLVRKADGQIMGVPSYPSLRLWPEDTLDLQTLGSEVTDVAHYTSKKRLKIGGGPIAFSERPARLGVIYALCTRAEGEHDEEVSIERLSPQEAFIELVQNSFQLDITGAESLRSHSGQLCAVSNSVPMFRLCYPHNRALLPRVMQAVLSHADSVRR